MDALSTAASTVYYYVVCFTNIILATELLFCVPLLPRRDHFVLRAATLIPAYCLLLNTRLLGRLFFTGWGVAPMAMIVFAASLGLLRLLFDADWRQIAFYGAAAYSVEGLLLFVRLSDAYFPYWTSLLGPVKYVMQALVSVAILALAYRLLVKRYREAAAPAMASGFLVSFLLVVIFVVNLLSTWVRMTGMQGAVTALYGAICNVLLLMVQFDVFQRSSMERERDIVNHQIKERSRQEQMSGENIELINVKCHDLKRQIAALRNVPAGEERDASIAELEEAIMLYEAPAHTGNHAVDTLLTERALKCQGKQIEFACVVDGSCLEGIGLVDLYALLGNALDNAIEAAEQVENPHGRFVSLNVSRRGAMVRIKVENTCVGRANMVDGLPQTTKDDSGYHGFGVRSIRMIVERLGGNMVIDAGDGLFSLSLLFPLPSGQAR